MGKDGIINMSDADRWFATCQDFNLCRMGLNGPMTVTQIMPILQWVKDEDTFLDVGCGSGTTLDALKELKKQVYYKGVDVIDHRIEYLKKTFNEYTFDISHAKPSVIFEAQDARHLKEEDKSWDIVWSRHVIDHLGNFEQAIDEHCRVAKKYVICVLWMSLTDLDEHLIKPIKEGDKVYEDEWTNQYSRKLVKAHLEKKCKEGWEVKEFLENVTWDGSIDGKGRDTIIVLKRI